jgi:hypothetical protein
LFTHLMQVFIRFMVGISGRMHLKSINYLTYSHEYHYSLKTLLLDLEKNIVHSLELCRKQVYR